MSDRSVVPTDGMVISEDTTLSPGVYVLPHGLTLAADHVTVDGQGALIVGQDQRGIGIHADGRQGVVIRGLSLAGYYHGIRLDHCQDTTIDGVTVRDTAEIPGIDTFLYLWKPVEEAYGGAILLNDVRRGVIRGCDLQHQQNGVLLYACDAITVERVNASFNSGWGVYLNGTSHSTIQDNLLDFCNRVYTRSDGTQRVEADAAGIVLVQGSSHNKLLGNGCRCGGDGIFIAGYRHPGDVNPCNDNLIEGNDCSLSPNNAIESTFSRGNVFRRNICSGSNYGFWLGFSWENTLEDNAIEDNRMVGIAAEHAHSMMLRNNRIRRNGEGVRLWTRGIAVLEYWPGYEVSFDFTLEGNLIEANRIGFHGYTGPETTDRACYGYHLRGNVIRDNRDGARFWRVTACSVEGNQFIGNVESAVRLIGQPGVAVGANHFQDNATDVLQSEA